VVGWLVRGRTAPLKLGVLAAAAVVLWGGYHSHWHWTGLNGHSATLWDWLNLLMLPVAVGLLPLIIRQRGRLEPRHKARFGIALAAFAVLVVVGYAEPLHWTGFAGNKLWDWLKLLVLPLVVASLPVLAELRAELRLHHRIALVTVLGVFAVVAIGGYVWKWEWTGFEGNTLWDWLHLLFLPVVVPIVLLPAALGMTRTRLAPEEEAGSPEGAEQAERAR
jgi:uncharacterized membrane protein